jgi:hypothetical protein
LYISSFIKNISHIKVENDAKTDCNVPFLVPNIFQQDRSIGFNVILRATCVVVEFFKTLVLSLELKNLISMPITINYLLYKCARCSIYEQLKLLSFEYTNCFSPFS